MFCYLCNDSELFNICNECILELMEKKIKGKIIGQNFKSVVIDEKQITFIKQNKFDCSSHSFFGNLTKCKNIQFLEDYIIYEN